jgi:hypothetical protein
VAEVTKETIYEAALQLHEGLLEVHRHADETMAELRACHRHMVAAQKDIDRIKAIFAQRDARFDRIDARLGLI